MTPREDPRPDPYATFRPRWGRIVAIVLGVILIVVSLAVVIAATGPMASIGNRTAVLSFCALCIFLMWRFGGVHADVTAQGITVHNVGGSRRLDWPQIVAVRFGPDEPWARLDLSDGDTVSVLAIQRADGAVAEGEARRLAALVSAHGEATDPRA